MLYLILFEDNPKADPGIRARFMADHQAFLAAQGGKIESAGPLFDGSGGGQGGAWVVRAGSVEEAEEMVRADPFWGTGLRAGVRILEWRQVFAEGRPTRGT